MPRFLLAITLSQILAAMGFYAHSLWWGGLFFLILLLPYLYLTEKKLLNIFLSGWLWGCLHLLIVTSWHWAAHPLDWAGINSEVLSLVVIGAIWFLHSAVLGLCFGLLAASFYRLRTKFTFDLFLFPLLWITCEYLRAWLGSILWIGPNSLLGPHYTIGFVGYPLSESAHLLPLAALGGVYLLSFIAVLLNFLFYLLIYHKSQRRFAALIFTSVALFTLLVPIIRNSLNASEGSNKQSITVAVVHSKNPAAWRISHEEGARRLAGYQQILDEIIQKHPETDLVVLPEDARFVDRIRAFGLSEEAHLRYRSFNGYLLDSGNSKINGKISTEKFLLYNSSGKLLDESHKQLLIPHGEYVPYLSAAVAKLIHLIGRINNNSPPQEDWASQFLNARGISRGPLFKPLSRGSIKIGALFCGEVMAPQLYQQLADQGAHFFVNASSHGMFRGSRFTYLQTLQMARVRAVEHNKYYLQAGNIVPSMIIDNRGYILQIEDSFGYFIAKLPLYKSTKNNDST